MQNSRRCRFEIIFMTESYFFKYFFTTEKLPPAQKAICLLHSIDVKIQGRRCSQVVLYFGKNSCRKRPTRFHVEESLVACSRADTPLKNARVVGTRVSTQRSLRGINYVVLWFKQVTSLLRVCNGGHAWCHQSRQIQRNRAN